MIQQTIDQLWEPYINQNPHARKVYNLFLNRGEEIVNDHIALRTFAHSRTQIDKLAAVFVKNGYIENGKYHFAEKKLNALHYEHPHDKNLPKIFISQLELDEFSPEFRNEIDQIVAQIDEQIIQSDDFVYSGVQWGELSFKTYNLLRKESEYAAWLYANGFVANHFTVSVNHLKTFTNLQAVNEFLKQNGFSMNANPNEIKGSPELFLEQSSIKSGLIRVNFAEGSQEIPSCYYEFALRYPLPNGNLFNGFIAESADKIFESTDFYSK